MEIQSALKRLRASENIAIKRPSMGGYIYREAVETAEGEVAPPVVAWRMRDGSEVRLGFTDDKFRRVEKIVPEDGLAFNPEIVSAFLADDWEPADRDELEKARRGDGAL